MVLRLVLLGALQTWQQAVYLHGAAVEGVVAIYLHINMFLITNIPHYHNN